jgi:hypothetical protein
VPTRGGKLLRARRLSNSSGAAGARVALDLLQLRSNSSSAAGARAALDPLQLRSARRSPSPELQRDARPSFSYEYAAISPRASPVAAASAAATVPSAPSPSPPPPPEKGAVPEGAAEAPAAPAARSGGAWDFSAWVDSMG